MKHLQKQVLEFSKQYGLDGKLETRTLDLISEVGELSKEILKGTEYGKHQFLISKSWKEEIGDTLFSLICLANESGVDLEDSLSLVLKKYEERFKAKGNIGSGK